MSGAGGHHRSQHVPVLEALPQQHDEDGVGAASHGAAAPNVTSSASAALRAATDASMAVNVASGIRLGLAVPLLAFKCGGTAGFGIENPSNWLCARETTRVNGDPVTR
jgi:hypothetical protein